MSGTFCAAAWAHLHTQANGDILPCCLAPTDGPFGNLKKESLEDVWNGPAMRELRERMLRGERSKACVQCYQMEDAGSESPRQNFNRIFADRLESMKASGISPDFKLLYLDFRFSNLCNFKCRSCGPYSSSAWVEDYKALHGATLDPITALPAGTKWSEILTPHLDTVEEIYFAGGEPLFMEEHYWLLNQLIARGRTHVRLRYSTNFSFLKSPHGDAIKLWKKFPDVYVGASLDAGGARGEFLRQGLRWSQILENKRRLKEETPHVSFRVAAVLGFMNVHALPDMHRELVEGGFMRPSDIQVHLLTSPDYLSLRALPAKYKVPAREKLRSHITWLQGLNDPLLKSTIENFEAAIRYMGDDDRPDLFKLFRYYTDKIDQIRSEDFLRTFPEFKGIYAAAFCSLPWIHLATHPHGGLTICCQSEMERGLSAASNADGRDPMTLNDRSLEEMINAKTFREIRLAMLAGERHEACGPCWTREDQGAISKRMFEGEKFPFSYEEARALTAADGSIKPDIRFAELRLGNVCNIKCVTCNPNSSIQFAREHQEMIKKPGMGFLRDYSWVTPGMADWTENPEFWDSLGKSSSGLKEVYINGGEPMLIHRHQGFLKQIVASGMAKDVRLAYSINMTKLLEPLREVWQHFREVHFACSVDGWDQRNFYIRYPSPWGSVVENFGKLRNWGFHPHVVQTVSALNFFYLDEFFVRWNELYPETVIALNDVIDPPWFSPLVIPPVLRREVIERHRKTMWPIHAEQLDNMYGNDTHWAEHWPQLRAHLKAFDEARQLDVREYFPELNQWLGQAGFSLRD